METFDTTGKANFNSTYKKHFDSTYKKTFQFYLQGETAIPIGIQSL